jgi:hypothetical protein
MLNITTKSYVDHMVCLPKNEGGLGVINLSKHNEALLLNSFTNSITSLGSSWCGRTIIQMERCLANRRRDLSGGGIL